MEDKSLDSQTTQLFKKILERDLSGLTELIVAGVSVNKINASASITPLTEAVKVGWVEGVRTLIEAGADLHLSVPPEGLTPLVAAIESGNLEIGQLILQAGGNPCCGGVSNSPLHTAVSLEEASFVKVLVRAGANINSLDINDATPLMIAAYRGYLNIVQILIEEGASAQLTDEYGDTALVIAAQSGHQEIVNYLMPLTICPKQKQLAQEKLARAMVLRERRENRLLTRLIETVTHGDVASIQDLLLQGANVNDFSCTGKAAIHKAAARGDLAVLATLIIEGGANLEIRAEDDEWTPLMEACLAGHSSMVSALIEAGANLETGVDGITPLMIAADANHLEVVKVLIELGADINAQDHSGKTALSFARQNGHDDIAKFLIDSGTIETQVDGYYDQEF